MDKNLNIKVPVVSVVMSVFNGAKYLHEAIESILSQTYTDLEFIIINDGSTDNSEEIIKSFKDERIIYIPNKTNIGLIDSLNNGLKTARGKYIARMDADDISVNNRIELQLKEFNENPAAIVVGSDYYLLSGSRLKHIKNRSNSDYQKAVLFFSPCFCHPTVMMKNIFREKNIFYNKEYVHAEDYKLWTELSLYGDFLSVKEPLLKYRSHVSQISSNNKQAQLEVSKRIRVEFCNKLKFTLSDEQLATLNIIGNNTFITSLEVLTDIENCLLHLKEQNVQYKIFGESAFKIFLHKFWFDSCGNTNLGLLAYGTYSKSNLSKLIKVSLDKKSKLLTKCLIRRFKKA
ncbi:MAG: glycosyltransferase family 2 protein [Bacteroidetes bacterium]|nr:glycosyltransferase family 2 protein [Bacteroidota bacterium]